MAVFAKMRAVRAYKDEHLHHLQTVTDYRLIEEIGFHQERGAPLTMKGVHLLGFASMATVQRRLRKLRKLGVILTTKTPRDRRVVELALAPKMYRAYSRYASLLASSDR
jgi:DNA-binding MarR family transcriptional regulator